MVTTKIYNDGNSMSTAEKKAVVKFLFHHLEQYGDKEEDIEKAVNYALDTEKKPGGFIVAAQENDDLVAAAVVNKTGMGGYIPENILVYIATHKAQRGKGIGKKLMNTLIEKAEGDIALHVEPDNPALKLYQQLGFTNKYLEMRRSQKPETNGIHHA